MAEAYDSENNITSSALDETVENSLDLNRMDKGFDSETNAITSTIEGTEENWLAQNSIQEKANCSGETGNELELTPNSSADLNRIAETNDDSDNKDPASQEVEKEPPDLKSFEQNLIQEQVIDSTETKDELDLTPILPSAEHITMVEDNHTTAEIEKPVENESPAENESPPEIENSASVEGETFDQNIMPKNTSSFTDTESKLGMNELESVEFDQSLISEKNNDSIDSRAELDLTSTLPSSQPNEQETLFSIIESNETTPKNKRPASEALAANLIPKKHAKLESQIKNNIDTEGELQLPSISSNDSISPAESNDATGSNENYEYEGGEENSTDPNLLSQYNIDSTDPENDLKMSTSNSSDSEEDEREPNDDSEIQEQESDYSETEGELAENFPSNLQNTLINSNDAEINYRNLAADEIKEEEEDVDEEEYEDEEFEEVENREQEEEEFEEVENREQEEQEMEEDEQEGEEEEEEEVEDEESYDSNASSETESEIDTDSSGSSESDEEEPFDPNLIPEQIISVTDNSGELEFLVKWEGKEKHSLVPAKKANVLWPDKVISFYQERISFG